MDGLNITKENIFNTTITKKDINSFLKK